MKERAQIVAAVQSWLGKEGIDFFSSLRSKYDTVSPTIRMQLASGATYPHSVHFREGMAVRNFLRTLPETKGWTAHDYDENWATLVVEALPQKE